MSGAPSLRRSVVEAYARNLVEKARDEVRVLALRADPAWPGPDQLDLDGTRVLVRGCPSSLAVREAFAELDGDYLVVLTDQDAEALGEALVSRFWHQRVELVDPWRSVAELFSAVTVSSEVKVWGSEFAEALADNRPPGGYPAAATGMVTADVAMRGLLAALLRTPDLRTDALLRASGDFEAKARWQAVPAPVREQVRGWARDGLGMVSPMILDVLSSPSRVDAVTVGLAADVVFRPGVPDAGVRAQARLESYLGGHNPELAQVRALASACAEHLRRLPADDPQRAQIAARAQQLLTDVRWPEGAQTSAILPGGYSARARELAAALNGGDYEAALRDLLDHELASTRQRTATQRAQMAVRLRRWLDLDDPAPATLAEALTRQMRVDAWVDWAVADVFTGSADPVVADAYREVVQRARQRRHGHDTQFANLLAESLRHGAEGWIGVEDVLTQVVEPVSRAAPVLLVVVDGMSAGVAAELADGVAARSWTEMVHGDGRQPVLAALPTVTRYSRTSLFCAALRDGGQADEKAAFGSLFPGARLFHKDDLRAPAGEELAPVVRDAIQSPDRVVAVVLNTVDDALAKADPGGTDWTVEAIQHLPALLDLAAQVGRVVILTSDHGHVVERGSQRVTVAGSDARYHPAGSAGPGEVSLAGARVLAHAGSIVAAVDEDLRYGNKSAGYHGGAAAGEVTIPLLVFAQSPDTLVGTSWRPAPPQAPVWWLEAAPVVTKPAPTRRKPVAVDQDSLFPEPIRTEDLAEALLASELFTVRLNRPRQQIDGQTVAEVVRCLSGLGDRAHKDVVARAAGMPPARFTGAFRGMQRLLNVEGYQVLSMDVDETTVVLNRRLLREQFGLNS